MFSFRSLRTTTNTHLTETTKHRGSHDGAADHGMEWLSLLCICQKPHRFADNLCEPAREPICSACFATFCYFIQVIKRWSLVNLDGDVKIQFSLIFPLLSIYLLQIPSCLSPYSRAFRREFWTEQNGNTIWRRRAQIKQLAWPMAERQIGHRKSSLVLSARFPVVNWRFRPVAKSA